MMSAGSMSLVNWMRWNCRPSERAEHVRERRLAHAGQVLDEQVAPREQAGERQAHLRFPCRG
jgi:hypothetical protein